MTTGSVVTGVAESCHEHGPKNESGGDPTIAFLTIRPLDTPLGRHGHPQLLALIDSARALFKDPEGNLLALICHDERQKAVDNTRG